MENGERFTDDAELRVEDVQLLSTFTQKVQNLSQ